MIELSYPLFSKTFQLDLHKVNVLVLENSNYLYDFVAHLIATLNKEESPLVLLENNSSIANLDAVDFIPNVFNINVNTKKNLTCLHKHITRMINDNFLGFSKDYHALIKKFAEVIFNFDSSLTYNCDFDATAIVKLFNPSFDLQYTKLLELLINYINILIEFSKLKLIIFLNLRDFMSQDDLYQLIQHCERKEVIILLIQAKQMYNIENQNCLIVDEDLCEILA